MPKVALFYFVFGNVGIFAYLCAPKKLVYSVIRLVCRGVTNLND